MEIHKCPAIISQVPGRALDYADFRPLDKTIFLDEGMDMGKSKGPFRYISDLNQLPYTGTLPKRRGKIWAVAAAALSGLTAVGFCAADPDIPPFTAYTLGTYRITSSAGQPYEPYFQIPGFKDMACIKLPWDTIYCNAYTNDPKELTRVLLPHIRHKFPHLFMPGGPSVVPLTQSPKFVVCCQIKNEEATYPFNLSGSRAIFCERARDIDRF